MAQRDKKSQMPHIYQRAQKVDDGQKLKQNIGFYDIFRDISETPAPAKKVNTSKENKIFIVIFKGCRQNASKYGCI